MVAPLTDFNADSGLRLKSGPDFLALSPFKDCLLTKYSFFSSPKEDSVSIFSVLGEYKTNYSLIETLPVKQEHPFLYKEIWKC